MLKLLKAIFNGATEKETTDSLVDDESTETKKCLHCLRRVSVKHLKCPHCRKEDFQY